MRVLWGNVALLCTLGHGVLGWLLSPSSFLSARPSTCLRPTTRIFGGYGVATNYTWTEEPFEMEITVTVPPNTRAKDIFFKASPQSIDLRLLNGEGDEVILLDNSRKLRGKVLLDGTFWVISDNEDDSSQRQVTVTIEKNIRKPRDDFDVIDYDWKGVYESDDDEVSEREYEEPEELDVREYAASLGVDIDNINMSMVDKTMFSSGLNLTRSTMDQLADSGYVQEVTQQSDGSEYISNGEGEAVPFNRLGDTIGQDEIKESSNPAKIPFLDTDSPWKKSIPIDELQVGEGGAVKANSTMSDSSKSAARIQVKEMLDKAAGSDPIDSLTVSRLKEVLREQGLRVSGTKQELRDRLRDHVRSVVKSDAPDSSVV